MNHIFIYSHNHGWRVAVQRDGREVAHKDCNDLTTAYGFANGAAQDFNNNGQPAPITLIQDETSVY